MSLPLLERAREGSNRFALVQIEEPSPLIPLRTPAAGEQYRFHFDMTKCIGCKCCEVACSEQNNNPPHLSWRRVGEIEAGEYPTTERYHLSMGCNHCVDAACLRGCPVDAYRKDSLTGLVLHSADACIGCQYCTWNCPYGVPQYNDERGVVGKCDMCYGRLTAGLSPACVNACPEGAIRVEVVNIEDWKSDFAAANVPGMPPAEPTISTTRITRPEQMRADFRKADYHRVRPEHPHWPLVFMLVLTQMSVGAFVAIALLTGSLGADALRLASAAALAIGHLALGASTLHLGRPVYAWRALRMWRRSWLSREVVAFTAFAGLATTFAAMLWLGLPGSTIAGVAACSAGLAGILSSAFIYLVPARPAWNSWTTIAEFGATAAWLGSTFGWCFSGSQTLRSAAVIAGFGIATIFAIKALRLRLSSEFELRQSARLLAHDLQRTILLRFALLGVAVACVVYDAAWSALVVSMISEIVGRYLFFVSVVPRNMAASFFTPGTEAA